MTPRRAVVRTLGAMFVLCAAQSLGVRPVGAQTREPRRFTSVSPCTTTQLATGCLIILGSGTPVPEPNRAGAAYALAYGDRTFLFDAGAGVMRRAAAVGLPIDGVTAAFLTHLHSDHTLGLADVLLTSWVMGRRGPFPLTGPVGTQKMVDHLLAAYADDIDVRLNGGEKGQPAGPGVSVREVRGGVVYDSAGVRITAVQVPHGEWNVAFAYVISLPTRTIVLSGDAAPNKALEQAATGADILVHETYPAVRLKPENRPGGESWPAYMRSVHTSDVEVGALAARAGVKLLLLSHIVRMGGTDEELLAGVRQGGYRGPVRIAADLEAY